MSLCPRRQLFTTLGTPCYLGRRAWRRRRTCILLASAARCARLGACRLGVLGALHPGNIGSGVREDRGNRWVLVAFGGLGLLAAYLPADTDRAGPSAVTVHGGFVSCYPQTADFSAFGRSSCSGYRFSGLVAIQPGHELVTGGIYRIIPNPSYPGLLVNSAGWARLSLHVAYDASCARTWRLIPGFY